MKAKLKPCRDAHPMQQIVRDEYGYARFRKNAIVRHLLDWSTERGMGLNEIGRMEFDKADREQFAQLIGYSIGGFGELEYVRGATYRLARLEADRINRKRATK